MSQVSAIGIQMFFEHIQTELSFFYKLQLSYENYDSDELGILLDHFKTEGIIGMYLLEGENKNQSIFGTPPIASEIKNITNIHNQEFYLSDIFRENSAGGQIYFYLCKKINPGIFDNKVFYIKLNLDFILEKYLLPLQLSKSDYAWVLDDEGTLIYHPNHKKMILKIFSKAPVNVIPVISHSIYKKICWLIRLVLVNISLVMNLQKSWLTLL
ncbi:MAG: cache domain-containing protein [Ignavibacteriales bacterium]|nr:cache domain-containing protein [Ignavibacteriales bacterium]